MILRRITEHVKTRNGFAVGLDFVIVVVGGFSYLNSASKSVGRIKRDVVEQLSKYCTVVTRA